MKAKTIWILLLALAACFGYLGVRKLVRSVPKPEEPSKKLFAIDSQNITSLAITPAGGQEIKFVRQDGKWQITAPVKAKAKSWTVDSLANDIAQLEYSTKYNPNDASKPTGDLTGTANPRWIVTLEDSAGTAQKLFVANDVPLSGGNSFYATFEGRADLLVINTNISEKLSKPLSEYRETTILDLDRDKIVRVQVEGPDSWTLGKKPDGQWAVTAKQTLPAKQAEVDKILGGLTYVTCEKFIDDNPENLNIFGLDESNAQLIVTVSLVKEAAAQSQPSTAAAQSDPQTLKLIFGTSRDKKVFAKLADEPTVFQLAASAMEKFMIASSELAEQPESQPATQPQSQPTE